jgi:hypothetical protein
VRRFPWAVVLLVSVCMTGCGGSHNDPGLTDPAPAPSTDAITGTVTYNGTPLAGVTVTLWMTNTNSVVGTAVTDSSGAYSFAGIQTTGNVAGKYHLWAMKSGYGFYPSVSSGAKVTRADHTGQFLQSGPAAYPMYLDVIEYVALPDASLSGANFLAYDARTPLVSLAATGQQTSYAAGDDGAVERGLAWDATRFTDNLDGTVSDGLTGLTWLKDAGCLATANWAAALTEAGALASGQCGLADGSAAGDWRMPNLVELESLIDVSASNPAIPANSYFQNVSNAVYWTSTSYFGGEGGSPNAWVIRMSDGSYINDGSINAKTTGANAVWAVKGKGTGTARLQASGLFVASAPGDDGALQAGVPLIYPRFVSNNDGTVTDLVTGLVWLKLANCSDIEGDWSHAVAAVNALASGKCGLTDGSTAGQWRMPNRKEMQSLADRNQNNEADYFDTTFRNQDQSVFQAAIFDSFVPTQYYWTSSTDAADTTQAWTVYSCDYGVYAMSKAASGYALAVRQVLPPSPSSRRSQGLR